jgi:Carboxypeptidase regulatory-like domain
MAALVLLLALVLIPAMHAQSAGEGSVEGTVSDQSGAVLRDVAVLARHISTGIVFTATTNEYGLFRFSVLPVGTYELRAERAGFVPLIQKGVLVTVGGRVNLMLTLAVAGKAESLEVLSTPLLESTRSQLSTTVGSRAIADLPVNGRDFSKFVLLTPGVTGDARGSVSFGGQRVMNSLLVDGTNNDDPFFGVPLGGTGFSPGAQATFHLSQEAVQEFQVNANAYSAELGRAGGGVINLVTKSGTNELYGAAFWFYRDRSFNANDPVNKLNGLPKDPFHFNQFGGVLGGPLRKDRLFFLVNYEGLRSNTPNAVVLNLPAGFQLSSDATVASFQKRALDYLTARAAPWTEPFTINDYLAKLDWQISPSHHLDTRWYRQRLKEDFVTGGQNSFEHTTPDLAHNDVVGVSLTSTLSGSLVNVARFSFVHEIVGFLANSDLPEANVFEAGQLVLSVGSGPSAPQGPTLHRGQWLDTLTYLYGRHALKVGADVLVDKITYRNAEGFAGTFRFQSLESFGRSLAGTPVPVNGEIFQQSLAGDASNQSITHPDILAPSGFVQDEWRARPNLTLNLGVRYDLQLTARPPVRNPVAFAEGIDTSVLPTDADNIAPRFGLAWTPLRSNRLVVRAGYGIFYAITPSEMTARAHFQNGVSVQTSTFSGGTPTAALIPAYPNTLCGSPPPSGAVPGCTPPTRTRKPTLELFARDYEQPYVQQGSFGGEAQLGTNFAVATSYVFSKGTQLQQVRDINLGLPSVATPIGIAGTSTVLTYQKFILPRPIADFYRVLQFTSSGNSIYHGLVVRVTKRFSRHYSFLGSYTLSKVIDNNPNVFAIRTNPGNALFLSDPSNPRADRGPGANDQRHRFVFSGIWEPNYGNHLPAVARAVLGGWQVSGILTAQTGQPYSGLVGFDLNNDGNFASDRVPGLGRDTFYLPTTISLDPRITRVVHFRERAQLQLIWEAFNVLNRTNITDVQTTEFAPDVSPVVCGIASVPCLVPQNAASVGLSAFGTPTASAGARVMQLAVRVVF